MPANYVQKITYSKAFWLAVPLIAANAAEPMAGMVDTTVIGATADKVALSGIAIGVTLTNFVLFNVVFLRMATTGWVAQAMGGGDELEVHRVLIRSLGIAFVLALLVATCHSSLIALGEYIFTAEPEVEELGMRYFRIRIFGMPAAFGLFVLTGWLVGQGRSMWVLRQQLVFSWVNIGLDICWVFYWSMEPLMVAWATVIAQWVAFGFGLVQVVGLAKLSDIRHWSQILRKQLYSWSILGSILSTNTDYLIRTWAFVVGFTWFTNMSASMGTVVLAGNQVLMQAITLWAFVLDAFAHVAESAVGQAVGTKSRSMFRRAVRVTSRLAMVSGVLFALATVGLGPWILEEVLNDTGVRAMAIRCLPWCALVPLLGVLAWQMDGVFIGALQPNMMRNSVVFATVVYIGLDLCLRPIWGIDGLWGAFVGYYVARGVALAVALPRLELRLFGATSNS
ncbi:MAG: MATE family efflux transporter [Myxococcales bacterium]|nr:MATE family efflux transporter [Myxococcales bacterium]